MSVRRQNRSLLVVNEDYKQDVWSIAEVPGPKPALQAAFKYGWIEDIEVWTGFLEAGNVGVYDYFGLSSEEYASLARDYLALARDAVKRIPDN